MAIVLGAAPASITRGAACAIGEHPATANRGTRTSRQSMQARNVPMSRLTFDH